MASQEHIAGATLGQQASAAKYKTQLEEQKLQADAMLKGHKQGADIAHNQQQIVVQREQIHTQRQPKGE
jgi:hypothetical protein